MDFRLHFKIHSCFSAESSAPTQPSQNLDYVYASVQKKSSEQNKLNDTRSYEPQVPPSNMNIHDPSSVSDNSGMTRIAGCEIIH